MNDEAYVTANDICSHANRRTLVVEMLLEFSQVTSRRSLILRKFPLCTELCIDAQNVLGVTLIPQFG